MIVYKTAAMALLNAAQDDAIGQSGYLGIFKVWKGFVYSDTKEAPKPHSNYWVMVWETDDYENKVKKAIGTFKDAAYLLYSPSWNNLFIYDGENADDAVHTSVVNALLHYRWNPYFRGADKYLGVYRAPNGNMWAHHDPFLKEEIVWETFDTRAIDIIRNTITEIPEIIREYPYDPMVRMRCKPFVMGDSGFVHQCGLDNAVVGRLPDTEGKCSVWFIKHDNKGYLYEDGCPKWDFICAGLNSTKHYDLVGYGVFLVSDVELYLSSDSSHYLIMSTNGRWWWKMASTEFAFYHMGEKVVLPQNYQYENIQHIDISFARLLKSVGL